MARTFQASSNGHAKVLKAFEVQGKTKEFITGRANCSRPTLDKFLAGKPVNKKEFQAICEAINLEYLDIAIFSGDESSLSKSIDSLVQTIRQQVSDDILHRCGKMRILDMEQPIEYGDIYTSVNILEKSAGRTRSEIAKMLAHCQKEDFDRPFLGKVTQARVPGIHAVALHDKLLILGKPGAGKTTFMKRLAMLCCGGNFQPERVPIFVTLKDFAEAPAQPSVLAYIDRQWADCEVTAAAKTLLGAGRALVLLDGLDEVREIDHDRVQKAIENFANLYRKCQIVITCRIAAWDYQFVHFTEVEVADFDEQQIAEFINKWFQTKGKPLTAERMLSKLKEREPVMELATNPLLLTLLCLIFGEGSEFPSNRSELYKEGLDVLLKKWDANRDIDRHQVYKKLSLRRKEDLLSQVAFDTFDRGEYFFKQSTVERHITDYIRNLPGAAADEEDLQLDSELVLRSIMAQHGLLVERAREIFSFSHLTFHEYFTAKWIVDSFAVHGTLLFLKLVQHVGDRRWREVFFLVLGMLPNASSHLLEIKQEIDGILAGDEKLQEYLGWLNEKCQSIESELNDRTSSELLIVRLLYLDLPVYSSYKDYSAQSQSYLLSLDLSDNDISAPFSAKMFMALPLPLRLDFCLYFCIHYFQLPILLEFHLLDQAIGNAQMLKCSDEFLDELKNLKQQIPLQSENFAQWQQKSLAVLIKYRNVGYDWQFTPQQKDRIYKYYNANNLLRECLELKDECYIDIATRQHITDAFCSPIHLFSHLTFSPSIY
jgi:predicted NACHT family NTPase